MRRRAFLLMGLGAILAGPSLAEGADVDAILNDPETPSGGDPKGDVTIVAFFDYNCPFCRKAMPALEKVAREDGHVRIVYKDWPILAESSRHGAEIALAAKYQDKYREVHDALLALRGARVARKRMDEAAAAAGVDMSRLVADLETHRTEIVALLKRTGDQADALGLEGTPVFLVGPFKVAAALDEDGFRKVIAKTRQRLGVAAPMH
jgi:protein-disulfide isomerase